MGASKVDVVVVGAGLNGLVAALVLARDGLSVRVLEDKPACGGVHRVELPFAGLPGLPGAPSLAVPTGDHGVGFFPRQLATLLGITVPARPSLFVPTATSPCMVEAGNLRAAVEGLVDAAEARAFGAMNDALDAMVRGLTPAWTAGPLPVEDVATRWVDKELRDALVALFRGSIADWFARFGVKSPLACAALAADALAGSFASWRSPGSGAALLVRHATRAASADAGLVAVDPTSGLASAVADAATAAGVTITTGAQIAQLLVEGNAASGVQLAGGEIVRAPHVVVSSDPFRLLALLGASGTSPELARKVESMARPGGMAKVHFALSEMPRFACGAPPDGAAILLLPGGAAGALDALDRALSDAEAGKIAPEPVVLLRILPERDPHGRYAASALVPWAPYTLAGTTWSAEEARLGAAVRNALERHAPGAASTIVHESILHPKKLETHFGVTRGHLGHVDETLVFGDRMHYATPLSGLYACGRSCAPAGAALGVAGFNAARRLLADIDLALEATQSQHDLAQ